MKHFELSEEQIYELAKPLADNIDKIIAFYENPKNRKAYEEWHLKKFGKYPES